ncbi:MAG TPA: FtsW/RodA/SpoVE family cell cycle protein [Anaerolineales bacterium]|nr:FtsW/RodA/SpoVE family cell cycle protein [Anaerolineales bacterium]
MSIPTSVDLRPPSQAREATLLHLAFAFVLVNLALLAAGLAQAAGSLSARALAPLVVAPSWAAVAWILHRRLSRLRPRRDPFILPVVLLLSGWGLILNWRLSLEYGARQTAWFLVGAGLFLAVVQAPRDLLWLRRYRLLWLGLGLALTAATLAFGTNPSGGEARLWLGCCGVYMQPSEPLRLLLVAYLASYLSDRLSPAGGHGRVLPVLAPLVVVWVVAVGLLTAQRDLGAGMLFIGLLTVLLYVAFDRRRVLLLGGALLLAGAFVGYWFTPVVQARLTSWLDPFADPSGASYQVLQSLIALAHGGLVGAGPGQGIPTYIPAAHTDFIFSALVEEWGMIGGLAVIGLIGVLISRGLRAAARSRDTYGSLLAAGLSTALGLQAVIILGGTLMVLPLTGIPLPFLSYGGSSLTTSFVAAGLLLLVSDAQPAQAGLGRPLDRVHLGFLGGWALLALVLGWWILVRGPDLVQRPENPRLGGPVNGAQAWSAMPNGDSRVSLFPKDTAGRPPNEGVGVLIPAGPDLRWAETIDFERTIFIQG